MQTPNFVFTDQVPGQQLMQLSQIAAAEDAARNQALLGTLQALTQRNVARDNAKARSEEVNKTLASNEKIAQIQSGGRSTQQNEAEAYNFALSQMQGDDPPTDSEFDRLTSMLSPERRQRLDMVRRQTIGTLNSAADNAELMAKHWNNRIASIGPNNKTGKTVDDIVAEATKSQAGRYIIYDPTSGLFVSAVRRPRRDGGPIGLQAPPPKIENLLKGAGAEPSHNFIEALMKNIGRGLNVLGVGGGGPVTPAPAPGSMFQGPAAAPTYPLPMYPQITPQAPTPMLPGVDTGTIPPIMPTVPAYPQAPRPFTPSMFPPGYQ